MVVNSEQMDKPICSPLSPAACSSPKLLPTQAVPPRPSNGETKPLSKVVFKMIQPVKKAIVNKCVMNAALCLSLLPIILASPMHPTLIPSMRAMSSCKAGIEPKPPIQMATKRRIFRTSVVSTSSKSNTGAH